MTHEQAAYRRHPLDAEAPTGQPQAELRACIAEALLDHLSQTADIRPGHDGALAFMPEVTDEERLRIADAVVRKLPPAADRAAVLLWAADRYARLVDENEAYDREHGQLDETARVQHGAVRDVVVGLRRLAAEAQQPTPVAASEPRANETGGTVAEAQQQPDTETREETGVALARYIADRPLSEIQAAIRILGWPPLRFELVDESGDDHSCAESGCSGEPGPVQQPAAGDTGEETEARGGRVVAYRDPNVARVLLCREHGLRYVGMVPVTAEELPDGGICTFGRLSSLECGRDVLIDPKAPQ